MSGSPRETAPSEAARPTGRRKVLHRAELRGAVAAIVGTRPGIIKMSPVIGQLRARGFEVSVIHTAQHYSYAMDRRLFLDLELPRPDHQLARPRSGSLHGEQTAGMLRGTERALLQVRPRVVLVCGDANTNLAGALAARKLQMVLGHVEAGLRSHDWSMPEEHNRVMIDHISDLLFAPTTEAQRNLAAERVRGRVFVTGNTGVDALLAGRAAAARRSGILPKLGLGGAGYILATLHREETVDHPRRLLDAVRSLRALPSSTGLRVVLPLHPRTRDRLEVAGLLQELQPIAGVLLVGPLGYLDFLAVLSRASLVVTDSGGLQEEACALGVPCVTLRDSTERPETVDVGANAVAGLTQRAVTRAARRMLKAPRKWPNPYGDGTASVRIADVVAEYL